MLTNPTAERKSKNPMVLKYGPSVDGKICSQCQLFMAGHKEPMSEEVRKLIDAPSGQLFFPAVDICLLREYARKLVKCEASGMSYCYHRPTRHKGEYYACRMVDFPEKEREKLLKQWRAKYADQKAS